MQHSNNLLQRGSLFLAVLFLPFFAQATVVTNCTEAAFSSAYFSGDGTITFACDGTITLSSGYGSGVAYLIDGTGHNITGSSMFSVE